MRLATKLTLLALVAAAWSVVTYRGTAQAQPLVTGDLVLYYPFDAIDDNKFLDGSGNGYDGEINVGDFAGPGSLTLETTDIIRGTGAANFNNSTDGLDDPVFVDGQGERITEDGNAPTVAVTYAAWLKLEDTGSDQTVWNARSAGGNFQTHLQIQGSGKLRMTLREGDTCCPDIVSEQRFTDGSTEASTLAADFDSDTDVDGRDFLTWQAGVGTPTATLADGDANADQVVDGADLTILQGELGSSGDVRFDYDTWVHFAGTWDMATNTWAMYYNGVQIATGPAKEDMEDSILGDWGGQADFGDFFAAGIGAVEDSGGRRTQGLVDELYIFKRALSPSEIATLALLPASNSAIAAIPEPGSMVLLALAGLTLTATRRRKS